MRCLLVVVGWTAVASAQPVPDPAPSPPSSAPVVAPPPPACRPLGFYADSSLALATSTGGTAGLLQEGLGPVLRHCVDGVDTLDLRLGVAAHGRYGRLGFGSGSGGGGSNFYAAIGGEAELDTLVSGERFGARVAREWFDGTITSIGLRWRRDGSWSVPT